MQLQAVVGDPSASLCSLLQLVAEWCNACTSASEAQHPKFAACSVGVDVNIMVAAVPFGFGLEQEQARVFEVTVLFNKITRLRLAKNTRQEMEL